MVPTQPRAWCVLLLGSGDGVAEHRTHRGHEVASFFEIEAIRSRISPGDLFPAIVDGGRVPALELEEVRVGQHDRRG